MLVIQCTPPSPVVLRCGNLNVRLAPFRVEDYTDARALIPDVSRCPMTFERERIEEFLATDLFHPFCAREVTSGELVGYAELYRLPHMGRPFDGRLERVIVKSEFRGNGLATLMCTCILTWAEKIYNCGRVDLTVENPIASHIYMNKLGFDVVPTTLMRLDFMNQKKKSRLMMTQEKDSVQPIFSFRGESVEDVSALDRSLSNTFGKCESILNTENQ